MTLIKAESVENKEHIKNIDTNNWYKISYFNPYYSSTEKTGYVFGAFLDPVFKRK